MNIMPAVAHPDVRIRLSFSEDLWFPFDFLSTLDNATATIGSGREGLSLQQEKRKQDLLKIADSKDGADQILTYGKYKLDMGVRWALEWEEVKTTRG